MRRTAVHALAFATRCIAGASPAPALHVRQALRAQRRANAGERSFEIALNVIRQSLERGDVDDLRLILEPGLEPLPHQSIDRGQEGRKRLAGSGRCHEQDVATRLDRGPGLGLRRRWRGKRTAKPGRHGWMKQITCSHGARRNENAWNPAPYRWSRPPIDGAPPNMGAWGPESTTLLAHRIPSVVPAKRVKRAQSRDPSPHD